MEAMWASQVPGETFVRLRPALAIPVAPLKLMPFIACSVLSLH